jgi:hypothetical protein
MEIPLLAIQPVLTLEPQPLSMYSIVWLGRILLWLQLLDMGLNPRSLGPSSYKPKDHSDI